MCVAAAYLQIQPVAVEAHPTLVGDLRNLRQIVIFKLIQADVVGQPGYRRLVSGFRGKMSQR